MKRKETLDPNNLSDIFDGLKVLDGDDEFLLLIQAIENNNDNCDDKARNELTKTAHQRYTRYLKAIDLTDLPFLRGGINKYLQCSKTDYVTQLKLMKQIDEYIYDILSSPIITPLKKKKQCVME
jgi:capsid portal protein